jgi:hypothetical protein
LLSGGNENGLKHPPEPVTDLATTPRGGLSVPQ